MDNEQEFEVKESPVSKLEMTFPQAIEKIIMGKKLTRREWGNKEIYIVLEGGVLKIKKIDGFHPLLVSDGDMLAEDWIVVQEN